MRVTRSLCAAGLLLLLVCVVHGKIECPEPGVRRLGDFSNTRRLCLALTVQQGDYKESTAGKLGRKPRSELPVFNSGHEITINYRSDAYFDDYHMNYLMIIKTDLADTENINKLNHISKTKQVQGFNKYFSLSSLPRKAKVLDLNIATGKDPSNGKQYSLGTEILCRPEWTPEQHRDHKLGRSGESSSDDDSSDGEDMALDNFSVGATGRTCGEGDVERMISWKFKEEGYYDVVLCHSGWFSYSCGAMGTVKVVDKNAVQDMYPREEIETFKDLAFPTIDSEDLPDTPDELGVDTNGVPEEKTKKGGFIIREFLHFVTTGSTSELIQKCEVVRSACWLSSKVGGNKIASKVIEYQVKGMTDGWGWPESVTDAVSKQVGKTDVVDLTDKSMRVYQKLLTVKEKVETVLEKYERDPSILENPFDIDDDGFIYNWVAMRRAQEERDEREDQREASESAPTFPLFSKREPSKDEPKEDTDKNNTGKKVTGPVATDYDYATFLGPDGTIDTGAMDRILQDLKAYRESDAAASEKSDDEKNDDMGGRESHPRPIYFDPDGFPNPFDVADMASSGDSSKSNSGSKDEDAPEPVEDTGTANGFMSAFLRGGSSHFGSISPSRSPSPAFSDTSSASSIEDDHNSPAGGSASDTASTGGDNDDDGAASGPGDDETSSDDWSPPSLIDPYME